MNPTTDPPAPQLPRSSFSCDTHPDEQFNGFCTLCLCDRLTTLDQSSPSAGAGISSSRRQSTSSSTATAALKAIFRIPISSSSTTGSNYEASKSTVKPKSSFFPELRRTQSFSASNNELFTGVFEPQRHSCDVRAPQFSETQNREAVTPLDLESKEEEEEEGAEFGVGEINEVNEIGEISEIRVKEESPNVTTTTTISEETVCEKTMKDHIDLDSQPKKPSSGLKFWSAASVFNKKWQKWMGKQTKHKRSSRNGGSSLATLPVEKPISKQLRDTQSEIADYGYGRPSCDTEPRFSLDVGRMSFDGPRYSFEEPRASWDGHLMGRNFPRLPPMVEDVPVHISPTDTHVPVVEDVLIGNGFGNEDENVPGGSAQTRDYYLDSSSRRRKSLDRSSSIRKTAAAVVADIDDMKVVSNVKVSPAIVDYVNGGKVYNGDINLRELNPNSLGDDCSETFELGSKEKFSVSGNNVEGKESKSSRRWSWNILGFIRPRGGGNKDEDNEMYISRRNGIERSLSGSWQELRREGCADAKGAFNRKIFRSNSSVSRRNSYSVGGSFGSMRKSGVEINGIGKKKEELVLERNRNARYSPNCNDNGHLRLHLPLRGSRRGGLEKSRSSNSHSVVRSVLRLY